MLYQSHYREFEGLHLRLQYIVCVKGTLIITQLCHSHVYGCFLKKMCVRYNAVIKVKVKACQKAQQTQSIIKVSIIIYAA